MRQASIYAVGVNCPLGNSAEATLKAYGENARNFLKARKGPIGADGMPITLSCAIPYNDLRNFELRLQRLFTGAFDDLTSAAPSYSHPVSLRLVTPRWLIGHDVGERLRDWIVESYPSWFRDVAMIADGDTLALYEIARALRDAADGQAPAIVVGALDSFMDAELLDILELDGRIYRKGRPHGLIPGEAAILILVGTEETAGDLPPLGDLLSVFNGFESEDLAAPKGIVGRGLAKPLRQAFETFVPDRFLIDMNGERWRSEELGFALSGARIPDRLLSGFETPLGNLGDCGAADSALLAALALRPGRERSPDTQSVEQADAVLSLIATSHREGPRCVAAIRGYAKEI
jgi:3-oxoacyl-[acyl-carrier-protein] synthase-1